MLTFHLPGINVLRKYCPARRVTTALIEYVPQEFDHLYHLPFSNRVSSEYPLTYLSIDRQSFLSWTFPTILLAGLIFLRPLARGSKPADPVSEMALGKQSKHLPCWIAEIEQD